MNIVLRKRQIAALTIGFSLAVLSLVWRHRIFLGGQRASPAHLPARSLAVTRLFQITDVGVDHPARTPSFTELPGGYINLWWRRTDRAGEAASSKILSLGCAAWYENRFVSSPDSIPVRPCGSNTYASITPETLRLHTSLNDNCIAVSGAIQEYPGYFWSNISPPNDDVYVLMFYPKFRPGQPLLRFGTVGGPYTKIPGGREGGRFAGLSYRPPDGRTPPDVGADIFQPARYLSPELTLSRDTNTWYLVGTDSNSRAEAVWFTRSDDQGKSWRTRQLLDQGSLPVLVSVFPNKLLLFYKKAPGKSFLFDSAPTWFDDVPADNHHPGYEQWPQMGRLQLRCSADDGRSWDSPRIVVPGDKVLQCRGCVGPGGRVWLAYVMREPEGLLDGNHRTSLWLTTSADDGASWEKPLRITDGTHFDREPDLICYDGKVWAAFSRSDRGKSNNIWVAEITPNSAASRPALMTPAPPATYTGHAVVQSLSSAPYETPGIMSGALNNPDHTMVLYARVAPPVAGVSVHFDLKDDSPSTIPASLSSRDVVTDADGIAQTVLESSNTDQAHHKVVVKANVQAGSPSDGKRLAVEILLPDLGG